MNKIRRIARHYRLNLNNIADRVNKEGSAIGRVRPSVCIDPL